MRTPVLIVGAGPVGLALANDLGRRGVACTVIERSVDPVALPKMNHVNARSMELCRRWGLADRVRRAGWPDDYPMDVAYVTSLAGYEIARLPFPSHRDRPTPDFTPEPSQRCPQIWFDPLLEQNLRRLGGVEVRRGHAFESFETTRDGVIVRVSDRVTGEDYTIDADYLVGADGAGSDVRAAAGIAREAWGPAPHQMAISLRARDFFGFHDKGRAAFYVVLDGDGPRGVLTPTDGRAIWRFNWTLRPDESVAEFDVGAAVRTLAGADFDHEIVRVLPWQIRFTLAEHFRLGRVCLAGDAARTLSPTGGLGMNTGLADAADLGWKLAACLAGWAGDALLESYDAERRSVGRAINEEALRNLARLGALPRLAGIDEDGPAGDRRRASARATIEAGDFDLEWRNDGAGLGARYDASPLIASDPEAPPPWDANEYRPTSHPGCRAPHAWLSNGRSTLDLFGGGFVLLRLGDRPPETGALEGAAARAGVPLAVERIDAPEIAALYERALVLVRPDGHVAWRGDGPPEDPAALVECVRGAAA